MEVSLVNDQSIAAPKPQEDQAKLLQIARLMTTVQTFSLGLTLD
jgi:hypothetical protein